MNLLNEPWLPVRHQDGSRSWIVPNQLADPDIVAFDADRADFNGALAQFAIGLLQTSTPVDDPIAWRRLFDSPLDAATLTQWFAPIAGAFEFDGAGARFKQDFSLRPGDGATCDIGALLIESPGENALKNNSDHFIKRGRIEAMCPHCAAMALLTLQINAPSGGAGHRTGLRGGGPLTTLVLCQPQRSLWHDLWLNVRARSEFLALQGNATKTALHFTFPWLADIGTIQSDDKTAPAQVHPAHVFWAMPRRIRLEMDAEVVAAGRCDLCGRPAEKLIRQYETKNYGFNYKGAWDHILSPYYETKEGWLPLHPQPGGFGYRHWLPWVMGLKADKKRQRPAQVVDYMREHRVRAVKGQLRLWAFGFDMDNMKARCWYESTVPLYGLADCGPEAQKQVESEVSVWLAGAEIAAYFLRSAVKDAWFSADARGDFSAIDASFWSATEAAFYRQLKALIEGVREDSDSEADPLPTREAWHRHLAKTCLHLFDGEFVGAGAVERQNPRRLAAAYLQLKRNLDGPKIRQALALPAREPAKAPKKAKRLAAAPQ
jgi:CRISPR system Cascade subunit CasA